MVARHRPAVEVLEGRGDGVQRERLPALARGGVVAGVEDRTGATGVGDRPGHGVHPDVVVAVRDQRDDGLVGVGLPQVQRGRLLGGGAVERLALRVGVDRALDQAPGLRRGHVAAHLDPLRLVGQVDARAHELGQRHPGPAGLHAVLVRVPRLPQQDPEEYDEQRRHRAPGTARPGRELAAAGGPDQQPDQDRQQPEDRAAQGRRQRHVDQRVPHLVDLALGLGGDEGVALDQRLGGLRVGLVQADVDADPAPGADPEVRQHRAGVDDDLADQVRPEHRVVRGQDDRAAAQQEQHQPGDRGEHGPDGEVRRRPGDQGGAPEHALPRGIGHGSPWSFRCDQARARAMA